VGKMMRKRIEIDPDLYSKLEEEWDLEKNEIDFESALEKTIHVGNHLKFYWKCKNCGNEWHSSIQVRLKRTKRKECPFCTKKSSSIEYRSEKKDIRMEKKKEVVNKPARKTQENATKKNHKKRVIIDSDCYSELKKEWDPEKNEIDFEPALEKTIELGNHLKFYWKCKNCGNSWLASIQSRLRSKYNKKCPYCNKINSVSRNFGCRVIHPEKSKLERMAYAEITPVSRKNSLLIRDYFGRTSSSFSSNEEVDQYIEEVVTGSSIYRKIYEEKEKQQQYYRDMIQFFDKKPIEAKKWSVEWVRYKKENLIQSKIHIVSILERSNEEKSLWLKALEDLKCPQNASEEFQQKWSKFEERLNSYEQYTLDDIKRAEKPLCLRIWQPKQESEDIMIPNDDMKEIILNYFVSPFHTKLWCERKKREALSNFDLNMKFFEALDRSQFEEEISLFLKKYPEFVEVKDLRNYNGVNGIYVMILDEYKQVYIGISQNIKRRIQQHWQNTQKLDALVFGSVESSRLSIDAFKHFDTTRIFVWPMTEELDSMEYELVENSFSDKFYTNRTAGGGKSLAEAIILHKERTL